MIDAVFGTSGEYTELSVLQRYCIQRQQSRDYAVLA